MSSLVNSLKGVSSRRLRLETARHGKEIFAARCGGAPISILKEYIEQQKAANV
jgi:putative transposase